ncbi:MAG: AAA family ATPase, partial [Sedimentisphaerales bacterium]|nr:AAA family ATPase [Sedimentisphaerales bacterium]
MANEKIIIKCPSCSQLFEQTGIRVGQLLRCPCGLEYNVSQNEVVAGTFTNDAPLELLSSGPSLVQTKPQKPDESIDILKDPIAAVNRLAAQKEALLQEIAKRVVGQKQVIEQILTAFFAGGHCLLLGVPGLAKTLIVDSIAASMDLKFQRIQFTPDLMPTDITGTNILEEDPATGKRRFVFQKGAIFTNILLADEINRTPPKTQAALLEAMQEHQVTAIGRAFPLPDPFCVLATQNPLEHEGTYPLPEAQLDRFLLLIKVDYPNLADEQQILLSTTGITPPAPLPILDSRSISLYQKLIRNVPVSEHVAGYAARLIRQSRPTDENSPDFVRKWLRCGCGPRAGQALILAAKAHAVLNGRFNISCQ